MERPVASDGGRFLKSGLLAFGVLAWAAPVLAQSSGDPLAPLAQPASPPPAITATPATSAPGAAADQPQTGQPATSQNVQQPISAPQQPISAPQQPISAPQQPIGAPQQPIIVSQAAPPPRPVYVPKDWRGVFDAIDSSNWASAQAGIAALPRSILTSVARAELYTAKGSPVVDLASLQGLITESPELPQADQLAAMAI